MPLIEYSAAKLPVYDVDLAAPPAERWKDVCEAEGENIAALLADVVDECLEYVGWLPAYLQPFVTATAWGSGTLAGWIVDRIAGMFGEDYVAEIRGVARHAELPLGHIVLGNLIYDICQIGGIPGVGCSSYSVTLDGKPTLARNMDWVFPASTGYHSRLIRFHKGPKHYESVSVLGCVGVVSAFCPGKWAVTINQAPTEGATTSYFAWPVLQRLRNVCDRLGSYRQLVDDLQYFQTMTSFFAHVVGTRPKQHTLITGLGDSFRHRGLKDAALIQTNHFRGHRDLEKHNSPEKWEDEEGQEWVCDSQYRSKSLSKRLTNPPTTLADARKKICTSAVTTEDTMQQMVFQPASSYAQVWLRAR